MIQGTCHCGAVRWQAGLDFIATAAIMFLPILHRVNRHIHWYEQMQADFKC